MTMKRAMLAISGIMMMAAVAVMFSACEKDKDTSTVDDLFNDSGFASTERDKESPESLSISPISPSVNKVGQQVAFTVRGGRKPYKWSVSDTAVGTISPATTQTDIEQAIYKAIKLTKNTVVVTDGLGRAAVVDVTSSSPNLVVSPSTVTLIAIDMTNTAQRINFTASGGITPYTWSVSHDNLCAASDGVWTNKLGQAANSWSNASIIVTIKDDIGEMTTATMTFK